MYRILVLLLIGLELATSPTNAFAYGKGGPVPITPVAALSLPA